MQLTDLPYAESLTERGREHVEHALKNYEIYTKQSFHIIEKEFELARQVAVGYSADHNSANYSKKNFNPAEHDELTIFTKDRRVIAFSSVWSRPQYPKGAYRIFSRTWKCPSTRGDIHPYFLLRPMYALQLAYAKTKGIPFIFMTMGGRRHKIFQSWLQEAEGSWTTHDKMIKVCNGSYHNCWQSCTYLNLKANSIITEFDSMSYESWSEVTGERQ